MPTIKKLKYPVLLVTIPKRLEYWGSYKVVYGPSRYFTFGRLPARDHYESGLIFDGSGRRYNYDGTQAWPQIGSRRLRDFLEYTIVLGIFFRICALLIPMGPKIVSADDLPFDDFKTELLKAMSTHDSHDDVDSLRSYIENGYSDRAPAKTARDVIRCVDDWIWANSPMEDEFEDPPQRRSE